MSRLLRAAVLVVVGALVLIIGAAQQSAAVDRPVAPVGSVASIEPAAALPDAPEIALASIDLAAADAAVIVEGWCTEACEEECGGECGLARAIGCTCYWICQNGDDGVTYCTGSLGFQVCEAN